MLGKFDILPMNEATAHHYAIVTRQLRTTNQMIGSNDVWIAAAALAHSMPVVTNNAAHFGRVQGLEVMGY